MGWWFSGLFLVVYGLFAFDSGLKVSPAFNTGQQNAQKIQQIIDQANAGREVDPSLLEGLVPELLTLIAELESDKYAYSSESLMPQEHHYHTLPDEQKTVLSTHMMLGLFVLITGFVQFVPAIRRNYRTAHRVIGLVYLATALSSMSLSAYYLYITEVENIYNTFVFYIALWDLTIATVACLLIAMFYIVKRDIARHLGWQALAFCFLLSAPIQRFEWFALAPFSDGLSFNNMNVAVNVVLWAQLCCLGYLLFCLNRASSPKQILATRGIQLNLVAFPARCLFALIAFLVACFELIFYGLSSGMSSLSRVVYVATQSASVAHDVIFDSGLNFPMALCSIGLIFVATKCLLSTRDNQKVKPFEASLILAMSLILVAIFIVWGYQIGLPSDTKSVGGAFYSGLGVLLFVFTVYFVWSCTSRKIEYARESLLFVLFLAFAPAIQFLLLGMFSIMDNVPEEYRLLGHAYQGTSTFALFLPLFFAFLISIYSRHTNSYKIN